MYIKLGDDCVVESDEIISVMDMDKSTVTVKGRDFLNDNSEIVKNAAKNAFPRSFVVCSDKDGKTVIYLSNLNTKMIEKKMKALKDME